MKKSILSTLILCLFLSVSSLFAQQKITGIVKDAQGELLPGVSVSVGGTTIGTITGSDGSFKLQIPENRNELVFSFLGFKTKIVQLNGKSVINVTIESDLKSLDEIVVVGFGETKKVNLTGSVGTVKVDEKLVNRSVDNNLGNALSGLVPGLAVRQGSGMPGNSNTELQIRGLGTVNNSNPLIVVDGIPDVSISTINMNDVESVSVLKDAAASAVYGSRAANGVILITTKTGKNSKPVIRYSGNQTLSKPIKFYENITNYPRTIQLQMRGALAGNRATPYNWSTVEEWMAKGMLDPILYPNTDWYDLIFQNGMAKNHNISAAGSSDKMAFYLSGGFTDQSGTVINNTFKRYNFRTSIDYDIKKNIKIGTKLDANFSEFNYGLEDGIAGDALRNTNPGVTPIDPITGRYGAAMAYGENTQAANLLAQYSIDHNEELSKRINGIFYSSWEPIKGLVARIDYGINYTNRFSRSYSDPTSIYNLQTGGLVSILVGDNAGISNRNNDDYKTNLQLRLNYEKDLFKNHKLGATLVYTEEYWDERSLSGSRLNRLYPNILQISAADPTIQTVSGSSSAEGLRAYIGRFNYNISDKYLFEATTRYDGSSKFSDGNRYGIFPSISAGWRFSEESFFKPLQNIITSGKIRMSWGSLGNNSGVGRYEQRNTYQFTPYINNGSIVKGFSYSKMINPDFSWESTEVLNAGLQFGILNNLFTAEFDYYDRLTRGMIRPSDFSAFLTGYTPPRVNVGNLRNRGIEANLGFNKKIGQVLVNLLGNFSYNVNNLEEWNEYLSPGNRFLNMPYQFVYSNVSNGIAQNWNDVYNNPFQANFTAPGDLLIKDTNGDGRITSADRVAFENKMQNAPTVNSSLNYNMGWKGFDFSALIIGTLGRFDYWSDNLNTLSPRDTRFNFSELHYDTWDYYNRGASLPRLTISAGDDGGNNGGENTFFLQDRSYLRLKNIQLGYTLPANVAKKLFLSRCRFFLTADNVFTATKWKGIDPEKDTSGSDFYPLLKTYAFGLNIDL
jgi:TonB-linked SusC/RagA family outer membrane protein